MTRYLHAYDLSMDHTGGCVFDLDTFEPIHIDSIKTNEKKSHGERLYHIEQWAQDIAEKYPPTTVAIERGFSRFPTSTQVIYRVHGIINKLFKDYPQTYYPPKKVKEAIIDGNASKEKVAKKINEKYPNIEFDNDNESDAFAVGLTYLIKECHMNWDKHKK